MIEITVMDSVIFSHLTLSLLYLYLNMFNFPKIIKLTTVCLQLNFIHNNNILNQIYITLGIRKFCNF